MDMMPLADMEASTLGVHRSRTRSVQRHFGLTTILVIMGVLLPHSVSIEYYTNITANKDRLREGETLTLTCKLTNCFSEVGNSSGLYFRKGGADLPQSLVTVVDNATVRLTIQDITRDSYDSEVEKQTYFCHHRSRNKTDVGAGSVTVGVYEFPRSAEELKCVSHNYNDLSCNWCPQGYDLKNIWAWEMKWSTVTGFNKGNVTCSEERCVQCRIPGDDACDTRMAENRQCFKQTYHYELTLSMSVHMRSFNNSFTRNPKEIVKPDPIRNLKARPSSSNGSRELHISWENPQYLSHKLIPLEYHITYSSKFGEATEVHQACDVEYEHQKCQGESRMNVTNEGSGDFLMELILDNLVPFTEYNISVRAKPVVQGYLGDNVYDTVFTLEEAPDAAPVIFPGSYHVTGCDGAAAGSSCKIVTFYWRNADEKHYHGLVVNCTLTVEGASSQQVIQKIKVEDCLHKPWQQVNLTQPGEPLLVKLVMYTKIGPSPEAVWNLGHLDSYKLLHESPWSPYVETNPSGGLDFSWEKLPDHSNIRGFTIYYAILDSANHVVKEINAVQLAADTTVFTLTNESVQRGYHDYKVAMSVETETGSSGLTDWLCVYAWNKDPGKVLELNQFKSTDTSLSLTWKNPECESRQVGKPHELLVLWAKQGRDRNKTLPVSEQSYEIDQLEPATWYNVTLKVVTRQRRSSSVQKQFMTAEATAPVMRNAIIASAVVVLVILTVVAAVIKCKERMKKWYHKGTQPIYPPENPVLDVPALAQYSTEDEYRCETSKEKYDKATSVQNGRISHEEDKHLIKAQVSKVSSDSGVEEGERSYGESCLLGAHRTSREDQDTGSTGLSSGSSPPTLPDGQQGQELVPLMQGNTCGNQSVEGTASSTNGSYSKIHYQDAYCPTSKQPDVQLCGSGESLTEDSYSKVHEGDGYCKTNKRLDLQLPEGEEQHTEGGEVVEEDQHFFQKDEYCDTAKHAVMGEHSRQPQTATVSVQGGNTGQANSTLNSAELDNNEHSLDSEPDTVECTCSNNSSLLDTPNSSNSSQPAFVHDKNHFVQVDSQNLSFNDSCPGDSNDWVSDSACSGGHIDGYASTTLLVPVTCAHGPG